jgi:predicted DsbA family dithiol-disulfide isomerase
VRVDRLRADYDVEIEWRAFELHPGIPPEGQLIPWPPEQLAARRANFARLAEEAGLPHGERAHWYDSTPAHQAAEWAGERGIDDAFRKGVFHAYFVEDRNIGSPDVLCDIAAGLGQDAADLRVALADGRYRERVSTQYEEARAVGVTGVPTFVAQKYAIVGAQPYEVFHKLMEAVGGDKK